MNIPSDFYIDPSARMGVPLRSLQGFVQSSWKPSGPPPPLPAQLYIGPFAIIGEHVRLGERVIVDEHCSIARGAEIGNDTLVTYRSDIGGDVRIGKYCVIGGMVAENSQIGDNCRVFGKLIHKHENSMISWDHHEVPEPAVTLEEFSFVGFGAIVAGGITIGPRAYVCAGAILTRDVPDQHIAYGINRIVHYSEWRGPLRDNPIFIA